MSVREKGVEKGGNEGEVLLGCSHWRLVVDSRILRVQDLHMLAILSAHSH